jgi:hypothetical protein
VPICVLFQTANTLQESLSTEPNLTKLLNYQILVERLPLKTLSRIKMNPAGEKFKSDYTTSKQGTGPV